MANPADANRVVLPMKTEKTVYRIDSFVVPGAARGEFLSRVLQTHTLLRRQQGFRRDFIVERQHGDATKIVTMVEWENDEAVARARQKVQALHAGNGFDPQEMFARLDISADMGSYRPVEQEPA